MAILRITLRGAAIAVVFAATVAACGKRPDAPSSPPAATDATSAEVAAPSPVDASATPMTSQSLRITDVRLLAPAGSRNGIVLLDADQPVRAEVLSNGRGEGEQMHARLIDMGRGQQVAQQQSIWTPGTQRVTVELSDPGGAWPPGPYVLQLNIGGSAAKEIDLRIE